MGSFESSAPEPQPMNGYQSEPMLDEVMTGSGVSSIPAREICQRSL